MAATRSAAVELFWKLHPRIYRLTRGRVLGELLGLPVLLLDTRGRKTGVRRTNALTYLPDGDAFVVIASVLGEERNPAWYWNLKANPEVEVEIRGERIPVRARETEGEERDRLWAAVVARTPDYAEYAGRTERKIPVMRLERR
jgi:deazaflavin-dependent oxidoreductase (nitroreductase family)